MMGNWREMVVEELILWFWLVLQLLQLLLKASQDKKFVCEEADKALKALVQSMTPLPLLQKLRPYVSHSNLRVRAKAAIPISNCVSKMVKIDNKSYLLYLWFLSILFRNWIGLMDSNMGCCQLFFFRVWKKWTNMGLFHCFKWLQIC